MKKAILKKIRTTCHRGTTLVPDRNPALESLNAGIGKEY